MPVIAPAETARATRRRASSNGTPFWFTSYIGANRYTRAAGAGDPVEGAIYPMAFLVEQDANCTVGAHYHQADQFQVIVGGGGSLGRHPVAPVAVHFAGAFTAYGPLRAGPEGLHYFTLRNGWDPGARYMEFPDNRTTLRHTPRQHREAVLEGAEALLAPESDGLAAWRYRLAAGERLTGEAPRGGAGQHWLVVAGSLLRDEQELPTKSCMFVYPDEPPFSGTAGPDGLDVVVMQFPRRN